MAASEDDPDMVRFLLARGADPNLNTATLSTPLEIAASGRSVAIVKTLLDAGAVVKGRSTLPDAVTCRRRDIILFLLERGANIDEVPDNDDFKNSRHYETYGTRNALGGAAWLGYSHMVELLLNQGADPSVRDTKGRTPIEQAMIGPPDYHKENLEYTDYPKCIELLQEAIARRVSQSDGSKTG